MQPQSKRYARGALTVILGTACYRLVFAFCFGPGPDEAFYWEWTRFDRLAWGYVEHPPMVAYAIWLMSTWFGEQAWAWRLLAVLLGAGSGGFLYLCARTLFSERVGFWTVLSLQMTPVGMAMGGLLLPESLLAFWMTAALYLSARLLKTGDTRLFLVLGVIFGLGLLSKLPAVLIPAALGLFALLSRQHRQWFRRAEPYAMVLIAALIFSPVIYWNATHEWAGVQFVGQRTEIKEQTLEPGLALTWQSLIAQSGYHTPLLYALLWVGTAVGGYRAWVRRDDRYLLLFCFSAPVMVAFQGIAAQRFTLPHWPITGYLAAYVMLPAVVFDGRQSLPRWQRRICAATVTVAAIMFVGGPIILFYPLTTVAYHRLRPLLGLPPHVIEPMAHAVGWDGEVRDLILRTREHIRQSTGQTPVVLTHFHLLAGLLSYHLRDVCEVLTIHAQAHQYDQWYRDQDLQNRPVLFVSSSAFLTSAGRPGQPLDYYQFDSCIEQPGTVVKRSGVEINRIHVWLCTGYHGPSATAGPRI